MVYKDWDKLGSEIGELTTFDDDEQPLPQNVRPRALAPCIVCAAAEKKQQRQRQQAGRRVGGGGRRARAWGEVVGGVRPGSAGTVSTGMCCVCQPADESLCLNASCSCPLLQNRSCTLAPLTTGQTTAQTDDEVRLKAASSSSSSSSVVCLSGLSLRSTLRDAELFV